MADKNTSNTGLAFIVGGLVVVVGLLAFYMLSGDAGGDDLTISIGGGGSAVEDAAKAVEGAVSGN